MDIRVPILVYHAVGPKSIKTIFHEYSDWIIDDKSFGRQMRMLHLLGYKTLSLEEFFDWKVNNRDIPKRSIMITFDDGYYNNYQYAFPILDKYNMRATVFYVGNKIREYYDEGWKTDFLKKIRKEDMVEIKKRYPLIEFASHSYDLHYKGALEKKTYTDFLDDCQMYQERVFSTKFFSYPYGEYCSDLIAALEESGIVMAFSFDHRQRKVRITDDDFLVPRMNVSPGVNNLKLFLKLVFNIRDNVKEKE